ncbi:hypothetical protein BH10CYA1_BH10CYA1_55310 [soil metagenome]
MQINQLFKQAPLVNSDELPATKNWHYWLLVGLLAYILIGQAYSWMQGFTPLGFDFGELYTAGERLNHGGVLYSDVDIHGKQCQPYVLPPLLGILSRPLALLTFKQALNVWFVVMIASVISGVALYAKSLSRRIDPILVCLFLITGFRTWPATMEFSLANCTFLVFFFVCSLYFLSASSRFRWATAAIIAAGLVKTWAIGLIGCLVVKRRWKEAAACLGVWILSLVGLFAVIGFKEFSGFLQMTSIFTGGVDNIKPAHSVIGFARLHFSPNKYVVPLIDSQAVMIAFIVCGALVLASGLIYVYLRPAKNTYEDRLQISIVVTSMLLSMPFCDVEYLVICAPAVWTLLIPHKDLNKKVSIFSCTAAVVLYLASMRIAASTSWMENGLAQTSGLKSLLVSDGFLWLTGLWCSLIFTFWFRNSVRPKEAAASTLHQQEMALSHG